MNRKRVIFLLLAAFFVLDALYIGRFVLTRRAPRGAAMAPAKTGPQIWMAHPRLPELAFRSLDWSSLKTNLSGIEVTVNQVAFETPEREWPALIHALRQNRIALAVRAGGFGTRSTQSDFVAPNPKPNTDAHRELLLPGVGRETAELEIRKLALLLDSGAKPEFLIIDDPFRKLMGDPPLRQDLNETDEMISFAKAWRILFPGIRFVFDLRLPGSRNAQGPLPGDLLNRVLAVKAGFEREGLELSGVRFRVGLVPPGPESAEDLRKRMGEFESAGVRAGVVLESARGQAESSLAFGREVMEWIDRAGSFAAPPESWAIESDGPFPDQVGPETKSYTMSAIALQASQAIRRRVKK